MFGNGQAIQDTLPHYFVDYREKLSTDPRVRYTNRIYPDGTWEPNLFQFFKRVYRELAQVLPVPFKLDGIDRVDETPAHESLREAICNTLIHSQYRMMEGIVIERYPDRLYFSNPGTMLIPVETFYQGGHPICRNAILQKMFIAIGRGEHLGSGADVIGKGWKENGWPEPEIEEHFGAHTDRVELTLRLGAVFVLNPESKGESKGESKVRTKDKIKEAMKENKSITLPEIAIMLNLSLGAVEKAVRQMKKEGDVRHVGPNKGGEWVVLK